MPGCQAVVVVVVQGGDAITCLGGRTRAAVFVEAVEEEEAAAAVVFVLKLRPRLPPRLRGCKAGRRREDAPEGCCKRGVGTTCGLGAGVALRLPTALLGLAAGLTPGVILFESGGAPCHCCGAL